MIHQLFGAVAAKPLTHTILAGDWNIVEADDPRFHPRVNKFISDASIHAKLLEGKLVGYTELHQPAFTRRQVEGGAISVFSRIDRLYSSWYTCELLDRKQQTSTVLACHGHHYPQRPRPGAVQLFFPERRSPGVPEHPRVGGQTL